MTQPVHARPRLPPLVEPGPPLSSEQMERWARHVLLPEVGPMGQRRLAQAKVAVVGAGGLGCPALQYLVAAGIGEVTVIDDDLVELSNLQRQVLHGVGDVGRPKVESAVESLAALGSPTRLTARRARLEAGNATELLAGHHLVLDGTDNFATRAVVDAACAALGVPHVWGSLLATRAQVSTFWAAPVWQEPGGPAGVRLRDVFPQTPDPATVPACGDAGVLGALCGLVGSVMALEVLKLVTGTGEPLLGRILFVDGATLRTHELPVAPGAGDPVGPTEAGPLPEPLPAPAAPEPPAGQERAAPEPPAAQERAAEVTATALQRRIEAGEAALVVDVRAAGELAFGQVPGALHLPLTELLDAPETAAESLRAAQRERTSAPEAPAAGGEASRVPVVLVCKGGGRARVAAQVVARHGIGPVEVLRGGMIAWSREVDPDLPRY